MMICCLKVWIWRDDVLKNIIFEDSYDTHVDVSDYASARRWLAFLVYLNDNFTGGETEFHDGKMIHPKTGTVLVFPCVWTFPHSGLPVKSGSKYILTTYFHYV